LLEQIEEIFITLAGTDWRNIFKHCWNRLVETFSSIAGTDLKKYLA
jgi:hypothetical protein